MKTNLKDKHIVVSENRPYLVSGGIPLRIQEIVPDQEGMSWDWKAGNTFETGSEYSLCRCGQSGRCLSAMAVMRGPDSLGMKQRAALHTPGKRNNSTDRALILSDAENLCAFARFCDPGGKIWSLIEETDDSDARDLVIREAMHCPAGRLVIHDKRTREEIEGPLDPSIGIVEDPAFGCGGPLWVQGGIPIESADGKRYETRNRATLCRCGASDNKPFCNGATPA